MIGEQKKAVSVIYKPNYEILLFREQSDSSYGSLPHDRYDIVTKSTLKSYPEDILRKVLERTDFTFLEFVDGEFPNVEVRRTDSLAKVLLDDQLVLIHIEFQVDDSAVDMTRRNVGYLGRCYEMYGLPVLSHIIYLRPNAGSRDPGGYRQDIQNHRFIVEYKVIRLIQLDGQSVFDTENIGFLPFTPLMQPPKAYTSSQWAVQCNNQTKALTLPADIRNNVLVSQWVLSGLINPHQALDDFLSEEIMQESSVYQHLLQTTGEERYQQGLQQGTELGARQMALKNLLKILEHRFDSNTVRILHPTLDNINNVARLTELHDAALAAHNLEEFVENLNNGRN